MIVHRLDGCSPTPLAYYLKSLGILRLVAEQLDPEARAWWEGDRFLLATHKEHHELLEFFLRRYEPTPMVAPWNKGSGFYYEKDVGLSPIEESSAPRFAKLREAITEARAQIGVIAAVDRQVREIKAETKNKSLTKSQRAVLRNSEEYKKRLSEVEKKFKQLKANLIPDLRRAWRGLHREWMDAALVLGDDGTARFPALLGTGGNDGRLDFTNNYFQRLNDLFDCGNPEGRPRKDTPLLFEEALFGQPARARTCSGPVGQFAPGAAGGANMTTGPDADSRLNPADFVLMLEGAIAFASSATRRLESSSVVRASAPFAVFGQGAGYASAAASDESARGEQWMPLWGNPATLREVRQLLSEGRAQIGASGATEPLDLARAVARLGAARGIFSFQRFGYVERNGQSNLAVPLGRFVVPHRSSPALACLDDLASWLPRLRRQARSDGAPARLKEAERRLSDTIFNVTQHADEPRHWQSLLFQLAAIEAVQVTGSGIQAGPIPSLRPEWVNAADDGNPELRLALSFALQTGKLRHDQRHFAGSGVRRHWLSLDGTRFATTGAGSQQRLVSRPDRVIQGRRGMDDAIAVVDRRMTEASQGGDRHLSLCAARGAFAYLSDIALLIAGEVDLDRTLAFARTLMAIDRARWARQPVRPQKPLGREIPDDGWIAVRLSLLPWPIRKEHPIGTDPAILRRLRSGDAAGAVRMALRRLNAAGIHSSISVAGASYERARLWAAALAFPITKSAAALLVRRLDPNLPEETAA